MKGSLPRVLGQSVLDLLFNLRMWICVISNLSFWHLNWNWDRKSSVQKPSKSHYWYCHHYCLKSVVTRHKRNIVKGEILANSVFSICSLTLLMQSDGEEANSLCLPISANPSPTRGTSSHWPQRMLWNVGFVISFKLWLYPQDRIWL